jgi:putative hemolysin
MRFMTRLTGPVVTVLSKSTELILKLWGSQNSELGAAVEEEIRLLLREGTQSGALEDVESQMVESVFRLDDRKAETIMTPRTSIQWLDCNWNHVELKERLVSGTHSIYPVGHGSLDNTTGYVKTHDILTQMFRDQPLHLADVIMPGLYLPSTTTALAVLEALRREGSPLAFLVDEHGGLVGMVTLRDLLESIVGFIPDSDELGSPQYVSREDGSYLINGMLSVHEFLTLMDSEVGNDDDTPDYNTVGGLVMGELERLPIEGDVILWKGIQIEVVDMDGRRVDKVITKRITGEEAE